MTHTYNFDLYKFPNSLPVYFSYEGDKVIPNQVIKEITTALVTHATTFWLKDNNQCMNDSINMNILKDLLIKENRLDLVEWLIPFGELTMRNGNPERETHGTIYVQLQ